MNGFELKFLRYLVLSCLIVLSGCQEKKSATPNPSTNGPLSTADAQPAFQVGEASGPPGDAILRDVIARYANAKTYQDNATLYLSYQLHGRSIQEPQRWSTTWDASGRLAMKLFNGSIRCEDGLLSCYVYDIESANIDNQHLLIPYDRQLPINQLFRDSIAKHFLGGFSELPLDETDMVAAAKLIPPPISLLTNQARNGWLQNPTKVVRLADELLTDDQNKKQDCFVVRCLSQGMTADIWIDQATQTLVQISLPLKLLAGEVITSPEITDVVLMAKFHDATFDAPIDDKAFAIEPRPESTPVLKYVALPETLPSEMIGRTAPQFRMIDQNSKSIRRNDLDGKVTTLLWLAGTPSFEAMKELDQLAQSVEQDGFRFAAVYSDSELKSPNSTTIVVDELESAINACRIPAYYDPSLATSTALQIKTIPSVIVLDKHSKVQFAKTLGDANWLEDVQAVIERVAAGEDVAAEMRREYQRFVDSYQQQLVTVSARTLVGLPEKNTNKIHTVSSGLRLRPEKSWTNEEFKQAGNVIVLPTGNRISGSAGYLIFDGWRTLVQLDESGRTLERIELNLPPGVATNQIRVGSNSDKQPLYVVFSALGEKLFLFDESWQPAGIYPPADASPNGIRDCQLTDLNDDGISELVVTFEDEGIHLVDVQTMKGEKISSIQSTSVAQHRDDVVVTGEGKIGMLKTGLTNVEETELSFRRVATLGQDLLCGLGMTDNGRWNAVGFDNQLKRIWTLSIGSQFFETEIEPVAAVKTSDGDFIWAIADTENAIHLVSGSGKWLGDFQSESQLGGVALANQAGRVCLIVSNKTGIECWDLNLKSNPMRPASTRK
jgi:hypothetical protein